MNCTHSVVKVIEFNPMGVAVSCLLCSADWQMGDEWVTRHFHAFESKEFPGRDSSGNLKKPPTILVRRSTLKEN